jgi:hypothetical protein
MRYHPRQVAELGGARMVAIEQPPHDVDMNPTSDPRAIEGRFAEAYEGMPAPWDEYWLLFKEAQEGRLDASFFMTDATVPYDYAEEETVKQQSFRELASMTGVSAIAAATLLAAGSFATRPKSVTRRGFLAGAGALLASGGVASLPGLSLAYREMRHKGFLGQEWKSIDEDDALRVAERIIAPLETAGAKLFGMRDMKVGFRNLLIAEKLAAVARIAEERGERRIAQIVGAMHHGLPAAIGMPAEARRKAIAEYLEVMRKDGEDPADTIATLNQLPEVSWSPAEGRFVAVMHQTGG